MLKVAPSPPAKLGPALSTLPLTTNFELSPNPGTRANVCVSPSEILMSMARRAVMKSAGFAFTGISVELRTIPVGGVGGGMTLIETVAGAESNIPSLTLNVNVSKPS